MGKGRRALAPEVQAAKGAYRKDPQRENKHAPRANGKRPIPPEELDEIEQRKWDQLCDDLESMGILSSELSEMIYSYCVLYAQWWRAREVYKITGPVMTIEEKGKKLVKKSPIVQEMNKWRDQMNRLLPELGLTPSARGRLVSINETNETATDIASIFERLGGSPN